MIGIYKITNLINNKSYIGQSVCIKRRISEHLHYKDPQQRIDRAIAKYGKQNFSWEVIEECSITDLSTREQYWINYYNTYHDGYNDTIGGDGSPNLSIKLSKEDIKQIYTLLKNFELTQNEIAAKFGVSYQVISDINTGKTRIDYNISYPVRKYNIQHYKYISNKNFCVKEQPIKHQTYKRVKQQYYCIDCGEKVSNKNSRCLSCKHMSERVVERPDKQTLLQQIATSSFVSVANKYGVSDKSVIKWCKYYGLPTHKKDIVSYYYQQKKGDELAAAC